MFCARAFVGKEQSRNSKILITIFRVSNVIAKKAYEAIDVQ